MSDLSVYGMIWVRRVTAREAGDLNIHCAQPAPNACLCEYL